MPVQGGGTENFMKVLNFGSCNIDFVYSVDHIVKPGETTEAEKLCKYPGGKGLNQSIALARAGAEVYHAGCVGSDDSILREILKESGVNIDYIRECEECTGQAIIQVDKSGENCIFLYHGANFRVDEEFIDEVLEHFGEGDALLLQNEISNLPYLVRKGKSRGMKIYLNPSPFNDVINEIDLNDIYCLVLNKTESECFEKNDFLGAVKNKYPELRVVLTLGKNGSIYQYKDTCIKQDAYRVDAVDTTGAGDTFTGYYISKSAGGDTAEAIKYASAAAGIAASRSGAAPSIPELAEVERFINERGSTN